MPPVLQPPPGQVYCEKLHCWLPELACAKRAMKPRARKLKYSHRGRGAQNLSRYWMCLECLQGQALAKKLGLKREREPAPDRSFGSFQFSPGSGPQLA